MFSVLVSEVLIDEDEVFKDRLKPGYTNLGGWTATGGADQSDESVLGPSLGEGIGKCTLDVGCAVTEGGLTKGDGIGVGVSRAGAVDVAAVSVVSLL